MNSHFQRGQILFQQSRYDMAAQELRWGLADEPQDAHARALLAISLARQQLYGEAAQEAQAAISLAPDYAFGHYAAAAVWEKQDKLAEAERAAREAVRLDPEDADYLALLSSILLQQRRWADALEAAEAGLAHESDHVPCTNLRAMALRQLGRRGEAGATLGAALAKDPENALTHANQGWTLLHQSRPREAAEHFREALRLDPNSAWARDGILEAMRARNPVYRVMLAYFLWMSRLSRQAQWGVLVGGWFGFRLLRQAAQAEPAWQPLVIPLIVVYLLFVYLTWTARPLFNLLLRLDPFGRLVLTPDQRRGTDWFGACLAGALVCGGAFLLTARADGRPAALALVLVLLTIPVASTFRTSPGPRRVGFALYTVALALVGVAASLLLDTPTFLPLVTVFTLGFIAFTWGANVFSLRR